MGIIFGVPCSPTNNFSRILLSSLASQGMTSTPFWSNPNSCSAASNNLINGGCERYLKATKNFWVSPLLSTRTEKCPFTVPKSYLLLILLYSLVRHFKRCSCSCSIAFLTLIEQLCLFFVFA